MKLIKGDNGKWFWCDGYATSQDFNSKQEAEVAMENELAECEAKHVDTAGIIDWEY
jgi:hypothetical protein